MHTKAETFKYSNKKIFPSKKNIQLGAPIHCMPCAARFGLLGLWEKTDTDTKRDTDTDTASPPWICIQIQILAVVSVGTVTTNTVSFYSICIQIQISRSHQNLLENRCFYLYLFLSFGIFCTGSYVNLYSFLIVCLIASVPTHAVSVASTAP